MEIGWVPISLHFLMPHHYKQVDVAHLENAVEEEIPKEEEVMVWVVDVVPKIQKNQVKKVLERENHQKNVLKKCAENTNVILKNVVTVVKNIVSHKGINF
jgi:2-phospho-L-lactate guanylyltransferase (CobY/MobA/RfbA family)